MAPIPNPPEPAPAPVKPARTATAATTAAVAAAPRARPVPEAAPAPPPVRPPVAVADRTTRLASLETALTEVVTKRARLSAPKLAPNQAARVTLTVPAEFAAQLREWSEFNDLETAAASARLTARLAGDGLVVEPDTTQTQVIDPGRDTVFEWTVVARPGGAGPLRAAVGAQLSEGDTLVLGTLTTADGPALLSGASGRTVGFAALAGILALVGWLVARARLRPLRPKPAATA